MKVNTNSWHYKFAEWLHGYPSQNLCTYFWQVAGPILLALVLAVMVPIGIYVIIMKLGWWLFLIVPVGIVAFLGATYLAVLLIEYVEQALRQQGWIKVSPEPKPEKEKQPNILFEYLRAKKEKICPLLEFENKS